MNQSLLSKKSTVDVRSFIQLLCDIHKIEPVKFPHEILWMIDIMLNNSTIEDIYTKYEDSSDMIKNQIQSQRFTSKHHELSHCLKLVFQVK